MKYSVIIPIFKAETTLKRCLDSLLKQNRKDVELLLINDGSPDNSGAICEQYASEHGCIRYFYKENGGVSTARNLGLDNAQGKYILFADSDDYVSDDYFEVLDRALEEKQPDMLLFGYRNFGGNTDEWNNGEYYVKVSGEVADKVCRSIRRCLFSSLWSKVFRRDVIENSRLRFNEKLAIGEDQAFIFCYATNIESIMSIDACLYHVDVENVDSLSRKRRDYLAEQLLESALQMMSAVNNSSLDKECKRCYMSALSWVFYRNAYTSFRELLKYKLNKKERRKRIRAICRLYSREGVKPGDMKCLLMALPVKLKMASAIDVLIRRKFKE